MTDHCEPDVFEVTWKTGHVDRVTAHQVSWPYTGYKTFNPHEPETPARVQFHAEIGGRWRLMLDALEADLLSIRNVTQIEERPLPPRVATRRVWR